MDVDKIKAFLVNHFEKMIFGLIVAVAALLVQKGLGKPNYLADHDPEKMQEDARTVKGDVDLDHNEEVIEKAERRPTDSIFDATVKLYQPVDPSHYSLKSSWSDPGAQAIVRREDPQLLPLAQLRTQGVVCSLAFNGATTPEDYRAAELEPADPVEKVEEKKRKPRGRNNRRANRFDELEQSGLGYDPNGGGFPPPGLNGLPGAEARKPVRRLNTKYDRGTAVTTGTGANHPKPVLGWFIAGTALIPYGENYRAFEEALEDAEDYNPLRDTPTYYNFQVQRADVTNKPVSELTDDDWVQVWDRIKYTKLAHLGWSGFAPEVVQNDYRDENLTMWIPPVMIDDYYDFATHPMIPEKSVAELKLEEQLATRGEEDTFANTDNISDLLNQDTDTVLKGPDGTGNLDVNSADDNGFFSGGSGFATFGRGRLEEDPVDHKLIRFYDFGDNPNATRMRAGRSYVYRLRYSVIDPNFPDNPIMQPPISRLAPKVAARVQEKMNAALAESKRDFQKWSDWSEPTEPTTLPSLREFYAGSAKPSSLSTYQVDGREVEVPKEAPSIEMVLTQVDPEYGIRAQVLAKGIKEGTVLSETTEAAQGVDPITKVIKKLPDYQIDSGSSVIDIAGGTPLKISDDLTSPSFVMIYDESGRLILLDNVSQQREFQLNSYAEERGVK